MVCTIWVWRTTWVWRTKKIAFLDIKEAYSLTQHFVPRKLHAPSFVLLTIFSALFRRCQENLIGCSVDLKRQKLKLSVRTWRSTQSYTLQSLWLSSQDSVSQRACNLAFKKLPCLSECADLPLAERWAFVLTFFLHIANCVSILTTYDMDYIACPLLHFLPSFV